MNERGKHGGGDTYACENAVEPVQHMLLDRHRVICQVIQVVYGDIKEDGALHILG